VRAAGDADTRRGDLGRAPARQRWTFAVDPQAGPERALVHRPLYRVEVAALDAAPFAFLEACAAGDTLDRATRAAVDVDPAFVLDAHLAGWVRERVIVELRLP
jgi:hypothetical protein